MNVRRLVVNGGVRVLDAAYPWLWRFRPGPPVILCYHSVVDRPLPARITRTGLHLPVEAFARQLDHLAARCDVVPLGHLLDPAAWSPRRRSRPTVAITFDDGYANNLTLADPALRRHGFPATLFVVTGALGSGRPFWWDELNALLADPPPVRGEAWPGLEVDCRTPAAVERTAQRLRTHLLVVDLAERVRTLDTLAALVGRLDPGWTEMLRPLTRDELGQFGGGVTLGNHTDSHRVLSDIPLDEAIADVRAAQVALEDLVPPARRLDQAICYPRGETTAQLRVALASRLGCRWGLGLVSMDAPRTGSDPLNLPRTVIGAGQSLARFRLAALGVSG